MPLRSIMVILKSFSKHARNASLPWRQFQAEGAPQFYGIQAGIFRPAGGGRKCAGRHRDKILRARFKPDSSLPGKIQYKSCITAPGGFPARNQVVKTVQLRMLQCHTDGVSRNIRQQLSSCRRAYLIIDNGKAIAFLGETKYFFCEIFPARSENPARAKD